MCKDVEFLFFLLLCHQWLFSAQNCMPGVCLKSQNMIHSVKTPGSSGMCGAIVFLSRCRFSLGMQTLIPWGVVQCVQLSLSTTLLFLPCCPSHPSLTEAAVSLPSHHCRGSTGFSNAGMSSLCSDTRLQCLGKSCHRVAGTGMWERRGQPIPVFGTGRQSESAGQLSALWMPLGCQRNGKCRQMGMGRVAQKCHPHLEQDVLRLFPLLLEAVTVCDSGCSGCPAHQPFHSHSQRWHLRLHCLKLFISLLWSVKGWWASCLNEVGYLPAETPPPKLGSLVLLRCGASIVTEQQDKQRGNKLL